MIRILVVDDQNIVRQGIQALLEARPKLKVVGIAEDGHTALEQARILKPDIVLMDIEMHGMNGITATQKICQQVPKTKVLVLSSCEDQEYVTRALQAGAKGYIFKSTLAEDLEQVILSVYQAHSQIQLELRTEAIVKANSFCPITSEQNNSTSIQKNGSQWQISFDKDSKTTEFSLDASNDVRSYSINYSSNVLRNTQNNKSRSSSKIRKTTQKSISQPSSEKKEQFLNSQKANENEEKKTEIRKKLSKILLIGLLFTAITITGIIVFYTIMKLSSAEKSSSSSPPVVPLTTNVAALGRLEPETEVIHIAAPLELDGDRLAQLLVKEGERVSAGQIIAILDSQNRLQNKVAQAKELVKKAQTQLAKVKSGAKSGKIMAQQSVIARIEAERTTEIRAQKAIVARLEAQLANSEIEYQRHQTLYQEGAISVSKRDNKELAFKTLQQQLDEAEATLQLINNSRQQEIKQAEATLNEITEVRSVDLQAAQAEIDSAMSELRLAQTNLEQSYIRAPISGLILEIQTRPGAKISDLGIVSMAQTNQMIAVAEVYQSDIGKLRLGQKALITSEVFPDQLTGKVSDIGFQVSRQNIFTNQPGENLDRRVIEVKIRLSPKDSKKVEHLTNLQVYTKVLIRNN